MYSSQKLDVSSMTKMLLENRIKIRIFYFEIPEPGLVWSATVCQQEIFNSAVVLSFSRSIRNINQVLFTIIK